MPNPERENLRLSPDATQISLNPKIFSQHALRRIFKLQIGTESEIRYKLSDGKSFFYSKEAMRNAKRLPKEKRRKFIDLAIKAILNSNELTIKGHAVQKRPDNLSAPSYNNVFRAFIEKDPLLVWLDK